MAMLALCMLFLRRWVQENDSTTVFVILTIGWVDGVENIDIVSWWHAGLNSMTGAESEKASELVHELCLVLRPWLDRYLAENVRRSLDD